MRKAFTTIQYGPARTAYHQNAMDDRFKEALGAYLERDLLPQVDEPYDSTAGSVAPVFNEERYCGPHSAVRDVYRLRFSFIRSGSRDELDVQLYHDVTTGAFRPRYKGRSLLLWTRNRMNTARAFRSAIDGLVQRIMDGEKNEYACPRCGAILRLVDSPNLFDLSCPSSCFNYHLHRDPEAREFRHGHFFSKDNAESTRLPG